MKDWLGYENRRNRDNAALFTAIMKRAFGNAEVLIGHHLTFQQGGDLETENEIPSADTLMFDHTIMTAVFGDRAVDVMQHLAATPCQSRDAVLAAHYEQECSLVQA
jgi:hypothetical protein